MKITSGFLSALMFFVFNVHFSYAYRPFITEDAEVAGAGVAQMETSYDYIKLWRRIR